MGGHDTFEGEKIRTSGSGEEQVGERIAEGAEGAVHRLDADRVVKIYEPKYRTDRRARKVAAMIAAPPDDPTADKGVRTFVWPTDRAESPDGDFLGFVMPYLDLASRKNAQRYARETLQWQQSFPRQRFTAAYNLAAAVGYLHSQDHAMGDMNHENVYVDADGVVTLLDCDAFHISGEEEVFHGRTKHPRYAPPEEFTDDLGRLRRADRFGLAVHLFQFLMEGFHPFQGAGPRSIGGTVASQIEHHDFPYHRPERGASPPPAAPAYERLPSTLRALFEQCFLDGKSDPDERPEATEWMSALQDLLTGDDGERATPDRVDVDAEVEAVRELLPGISREDFVETDAGVGFEFALPPVDCPVEVFRFLVDYTPEYPESPPDIRVLEPALDPETAPELVAGTDSQGNVEVAPPPGFEWEPDDTGKQAVQMAAQWAHRYCRHLDS